MDEKFVETLIWLIANEKCESKFDCQQLFCEIYNLLLKCEKLSLPQKIFSNDDAENLHLLSYKMKDQFMSQFLKTEYTHNNSTSKLNDGLKSGKYQSEFDEISSIGSGSFGTVYKVKNKIDEQLYAIKKIVFNGNEFIFKYDLI